MRKSAFLASQEDNVVVVHIIWGLKEQDRSDCHMTDLKCNGRTVFDDSFDVNPPPCQTALLVRFVIRIRHEFHRFIFHIRLSTVPTFLKNIHGPI